MTSLRAAGILTALVVSCAPICTYAQTATCSNSGIPVYAPQGQVIQGFPLHLILDHSAVVSGSYSICYSSAIQYTVEWNSSTSISDLDNEYKQYLTANGWAITNDVTKYFPSSLGLYASNVWSDVTVSLSALGTGSQVTISFVAKQASSESGCDTPAVPIYAPVGQVVHGFPLQLRLDPASTITGSYSICYSSATMQYTLEEKSSQSITSMHDAFKKFLPLTGWTISGELTSHFPVFLALSAVNGSSQLQIISSASGTGSWETITVVAKAQDPPTGLSAVAGDKRVQLHWVSPQFPPDEYKVYVYQVGSSASTLLDTQVLPNSIEVTSDSISALTVGGSLNNGQLYEFSVTAVGPQGESTAASIFAQPGTFVAPAHPSNPILFLHGLNADASAWQSTADYLMGTLHWTCGGTLSYLPSISMFPLTNVSGMPSTCSPFQSIGDFFTVNFGDNLANYSDGRAIMHQGDEVGGFLQALQSRGKFSLVAWSMGGLAARSYIQLSDPGAAPDQISDLTTLGTPNWGVHLAYLRSPVLNFVAQKMGLGNALSSQGANAMDGGCVSNGDSTDYAGQLSSFLYAIDRSTALPTGIRYTAISGTPLVGIHSDECNVPLIYIGEPPQVQTDLVVPAMSSTFTGIIPTPQLWNAFNRNDNHLYLPNDVTGILCALDRSCAILKVFSPVDIQVTAPNGQSISNSLTTMPGAEYTSIVDPTGHETTSVLIPFPQSGQYSVLATPKAGALPTDTFTITFTQNGETTTIANGMGVQNIPPNGFHTQVKSLPVASAGAPQFVQSHGHQQPWVMLDGSASRDTNGLKLTYTWTDALGNVIGTKAETRIKAQVGVAFYTLTVNDATGLAASAQTSITVQEFIPPGHSN